MPQRGLVNKTYSDLMVFSTIAIQLRGTNKVPLTKREYWIDKMLLRVQQAGKEIDQWVSERSFDLKVSYASVNKDGNLITEGGNYVYSPENRLLLEKELRELIKERDSQELEIEPCITEDTSGLSLKEWEAFRGLLIEDIDMPIPTE